MRKPKHYQTIINHIKKLAVPSAHLKIIGDQYLGTDETGKNYVLAITVFNKHFKNVAVNIIIIDPKAKELDLKRNIVVTLDNVKQLQKINTDNFGLLFNEKT